MIGMLKKRVKHKNTRVLKITKNLSRGRQIMKINKNK